MKSIVYPQFGRNAFPILVCSMGGCLQKLKIMPIGVDDTEKWKAVGKKVKHFQPVNTIRLFTNRAVPLRLIP